MLATNVPVIPSISQKNRFTSKFVSYAWRDTTPVDGILTVDGNVSGGNPVTPFFKYDGTGAAPLNAVNGNVIGHWGSRDGNVVVTAVDDATNGPVYLITLPDPAATTLPATTDPATTDPSTTDPSTTDPNTTGAPPADCCTLVFGWCPCC